MYQLLKVEERHEGSHHPVKKMRREGWVPGVLFGKDFDSTSFMVQVTHLKKFLAHSGKVFEIEVHGKKHLVNLDNVQYDHLGNHMMHLALHKLKANVETKVMLPLHMHGDAIGVKNGGVVSQKVSEVEVTGLPSKMPEFIEVDVSEMDVNGSVHVSDVTLPEGLKFTHTDEAMVLFHCAPPTKLEVVETPAEEVAEPELVGKESKGEEGEVHEEVDKEAS